MEVPFSLTVESSDLGLTKTTASQVVLTGTIDLKYKNKNGWHIVDYKTDSFDGEVDSFVKYYTPQVKAYVRFWEQITSEKVSSAGLFFTQNKQFVAIDV